VERGVKKRGFFLKPLICVHDLSPCAGAVRSEAIPIQRIRVRKAVSASGQRYLIKRELDRNFAKWVLFGHCRVATSQLAHLHGGYRPQDGPMVSQDGRRFTVSSRNRSDCCFDDSKKKAYVEENQTFPRPPFERYSPGCEVCENRCQRLMH
jgi:hypothetical protein